MSYLTPKDPHESFQDYQRRLEQEGRATRSAAEADLNRMLAYEVTNYQREIRLLAAHLLSQQLPLWADKADYQATIPFALEAAQELYLQSLSLSPPSVERQRRLNQEEGPEKNYTPEEDVPRDYEGESSPYMEAAP
jgi:hypothetical protein